MVGIALWKYFKCISKECPECRLPDLKVLSSKVTSSCIGAAN